MPFGGLLSAGLISGAGSLVGGLFGGSAATQAAQIQSQAALQAAQMEQQEFGQALGFEQNVWGQDQANESPFLTAGQGAVTSLSSLLNSGAFTPATFTPPTTAQMTDPNNPEYAGYQFALQQGENAIQNSAAAKGGLLSGNTATALNQYATGDADQYAQQQYNNALQQNQLGIQNQQIQFGNLASLAGFGQSAVGQLASAGGNMSGQVANTLGSLGNSQAAGINNAAAASASGVVGSANAYSGMFSNLGNTASQLSLASLLNPSNQSGYSGGYSVPSPTPPSPLVPNYAYPGGSNVDNEYMLGQLPTAPASLLNLQGYAKGGKIRKGQVAVVGEEGPELFKADRDGTILPHRYFNRYKKLSLASLLRKKAA